MWKVQRRFNAKDRIWQRDEEVPVDEFTHRAIQSMTSLGWIKEFPDPPDEEKPKQGRKKAKK